MQAVVARLLAASSQAVNLDQITPAGASFQPLEPLTDREKQILVYLANGVSNKEIARRIFVSENTVKFHLKNIYSKLAVSSRLQAINPARPKDWKSDVWGKSVSVRVDLGGRGT